MDAFYYCRMILAHLLRIRARFCRFLLSLPDNDLGVGAVENVFLGLIRVPQSNVDAEYKYE